MKKLFFAATLICTLFAPPLLAAHQADEAEEPAISVSAPEIAAIFSNTDQWFSVMAECRTTACQKWVARIELRNKNIKQVIDLNLAPDSNGQYRTVGLRVNALAQYGDGYGVLLTPGEYIVVISFLSGGHLQHKFRLGSLEVGLDSITGRSVSFYDSTDEKRNEPTL